MNEGMKGHGHRNLDLAYESAVLARVQHVWSWGRLRSPGIPSGNTGVWKRSRGERREAGPGITVGSVPSPVGTGQGGPTTLWPPWQHLFGGCGGETSEHGTAQAACRESSSDILNHQHLVD